MEEGSVVAAQAFDLFIYQVYTDRGVWIAKPKWTDTVYHKANARCSYNLQNPVDRDLLQGL